MATKFCAILITFMPLASASIALNHGGGYGNEGFGGGYASEGEGYAPITDLKHLGTFVGQKLLPPKIIRITKTVAVKVPIPYEVKVPYEVKYPVIVPKPYPVQVPQIIKIKEQVPVPVHSDGGAQSGGYLSGPGGNFETIGSGFEGQFSKGANNGGYFSGPQIVGGYTGLTQGGGDNSAYHLALAGYQGNQGQGYQGYEGQAYQGQGQGYQVNGYEAQTASGSIEQEHIQSENAGQSSGSGYGSHR